MFKKIFYSGIVVIDFGLTGYSAIQCWKTAGSNMWVLWLVATLFFLQEVSKDAEKL